MKVILSLLLLFVGQLIYAQEVEIVNIEQKQKQELILYRGYANKLKIVGIEGRNYSMRGYNVSISLSGDHYIVKPGRGEVARISIVERTKDSRKTIVTNEYRILPLPRDKQK